MSRHKASIWLVALIAIWVTVFGAFPANAESIGQQRDTPVTAQAGTQYCYPNGMNASTNLVEPAVTLGATGQYSAAECAARYKKVLKSSVRTNGALPQG